MKYRLKIIRLMFFIGLIYLLCGCGDNDSFENEIYFNGYMDGFAEAQSQVNRLDSLNFDLYSYRYILKKDSVLLYRGEMFSLLTNLCAHSLQEITYDQQYNKTIAKNYRNWLRKK